MQFDEAMESLRSAGTAQNRKVYARHGVGDNQFGVSYAHLNAMVKKIKRDHALAEQLWATGNHDARVLALMIADPDAATARQIDGWAKDLDNHALTDAFAGFVSKTPHVQAKAAKWPSAKGEWLSTVGWYLIGRQAMNDPALPDAYFEEHLGTIERDIHAQKNWIRYAMNSALIAIGVRNPNLTAQALAAAKRIGLVEVDHGETGCKTPDAAAYIQKTLARKKR
jgi:3-methyladenine DNA glycosylase AlkD